jgi:hypothetical protein
LVKWDSLRVKWVLLLEKRGWLLGSAQSEVRGNERRSVIACRLFRDKTLKGKNLWRRSVSVGSMVRERRGRERRRGIRSGWAFTSHWRAE